MICNCSGAAKTALSGPNSVPTFTVPHEGRWVGIPASHGVLQPGDQVRHRLRVLPIQRSPADDALDGLAMFSQDPLSGVKSGITPCANNQVVIDVLR